MYRIEWKYKDKHYKSNGKESSDIEILKAWVDKANNDYKDIDHWICNCQTGEIVYPISNKG